MNKNQMKILLLGATGRTGKHTLDNSLKSGHIVNVLVRDKNKVEITSKNLFLFEGTPTDKVALKNAAEGCDAIISTINIVRTSDFPWSKLRTPANFLSESMKNIIEVAKEKNIQRIVICSAWGFHETKRDIPIWFRLLIDHSNIGVAYRDHELQENLLQASTLDWTIVRPVGLTNSDKDKKTLLTINNSTKPRLTVSRKSVAKFMVSTIEHTTYEKQSVIISNK